MKDTRKNARQRLKNATKNEFENLIENANLTPLQNKIVRLHITKEQTMALSFCESSVRKILKAVYDKIAKLYFQKKNHCKNPNPSGKTSQDWEKCSLERISVM